MPDWLNMYAQLQHFPCENTQMLTLGCFWNLEQKNSFFPKLINFSSWVTESEGIKGIKEIKENENIKDIFILFYFLIDRLKLQISTKAILLLIMYNR